MKRIIACLIIICSPLKVLGQVPTDDQADSILIEKIEDSVEPDKVLYAEPLFIDLIRDLGARKGEKEWNFGMGLTDFKSYDEYEFLAEYEFAILHRFIDSTRILKNQH